jgi:hypothetical protein
MIEKICSFQLPEMSEIRFPGFFEEAHIQRTGLANVILERDMRRPHERIGTIHIVRLKSWWDIHVLELYLQGSGLRPATLCQLLPLALIPEFRYFESIFALGSVAENGSVPSLFLPKRLDYVIESERPVQSNENRRAEVIEMMRGGRHISADFLSRHNSKNSLFAVYED